jgi:hypothetical protein
VIFGACANETPTEPGINSMSIGQIHNEFLSLLYAEFDTRRVSPKDAVSKDLAAYEVANRLAAKYGLEPLTLEEVQQHLERGRQMARQDPVELVRFALGPEEFKWWYRFADEAEVDNARETYEKHCDLYGAPEAGSMLANIIDISLSSAEFWVERRGSQEPKYGKNLPGIQKAWWKKLLRFATIVTADAVGGGLAGGTGGVVGAAIVGGLCSHAADDILFG